MHTRQSRQSRRSFMGVFSGAAIATLSPVRALANPFGDIESGGIGMSQPEWEAVFGPGDAGQSYLIYTYPTFSAEMHVGFDAISRRVDYFYIPLAKKPVDEGLDRELTLSMIASLLPHDARLRETFVRNETPGSLVQVTTEIWTSRSLSRVLDGRRTIMVQYKLGAGSGVSLVTIDVEHA